jgi:hypothetical protein
MQYFGIFGAFFFGVIIGWFVYFTNRYRKGDVQFNDIASLIGIIAGAAVTGLMGDAKTTLFGAYGVGLAVGFFGYFFTLYRLVKASNGAYELTWFIDGRRKKLPDDMEIPDETRVTTAPMSMRMPLPERVASIETQLESVMTRSAAIPRNSPLAQVVSERDEAIATVVEVLRELLRRIGSAADDDERRKLAAAHDQLTGKLDELVALRLRDIPASEATGTPLAKLRGIASEVKEEAKRMKSAADALDVATSLIDRLTKLIGFLGGVFA